MTIDVDELAQHLAAQWIDRCLRRGRRPHIPSAAELTTVAVLTAAIRAGPPGSSTTTVTRHDSQNQVAQLLLTIERLDGQMNIYESSKLLASTDSILR